MTAFGVTDNLYPSSPNVLSGLATRLSRIALLPDTLFTRGTLNPAGVVIAWERKTATLFASSLELVTSITVLPEIMNDPALGTTETGRGTILIEEVVCEE